MHVYITGLAIDSTHVKCQEGLREAKGAKAKAEAVTAYYEDGKSAFEKGLLLAEFREVQTERFSEAITAFQSGLAIDNVDTRCQQGLREAQEAKAKTDALIACYEEGRIHLQSQRYIEAINAFESGLAIDSK